MLASVHAKLDRILSASASKPAGAPAPQKTEEERDEERLRDIEPRIEDVVDLLTHGHDRTKAERDLDIARARVTEAGHASTQRVFHATDDRGATRFPTTQRTSAKMGLAEALKLHARVHSHPRDLEHALHVLVHEQTEILERQHARALQARLARMSAD